MSASLMPTTPVSAFLTVLILDPFSVVGNIKGPFALAAFAIAAIGFYVATRLKPKIRPRR